MTFHAADPEHATMQDVAVARARRFWTPKDPAYALPTSQPTPGGHSGHAAISNAPPSLDSLRDARKRLRRLGVSVARPAAVVGPVPSIPVVHPSFVSFAAERVVEGPWGPAVWVVSNVVTGQEIARYGAGETDGPGAILRALQEQQCWQERRRKERAS